MMQVGFAALGLVKRNGPLDVERRIREVHEGIGLLLLETPMGVHEIRVCGAVFEGLEAVAHAARHENRLRRVERARVDLTESLAGAQIHPCAEHGTGCDGDVFVPRFCVNASRHATLRIEADVVLHRAEVRQAERHFLGALPVLLEPAAVIAMHRQIEHDEAGNVGLGDFQFLFKFHERSRSLHQSRSPHN